MVGLVSHLVFQLHIPSYPRKTHFQMLCCPPIITFLCAIIHPVRSSMHAVYAQLTHKVKRKRNIRQYDGKIW